MNGGQFPVGTATARAVATDRASARGWVSSVGVRGNTTVLVRTSSDAEFRARLVHAAEVLGTVAHPGVERLVALEDDEARTRLLTEFAGGRSLATTPPRIVRDLPDIAVTVLETVRDLHSVGVTHGPISASQVVLSADDTPVLCDFSRGDHAGTSRFGGRARADLQSMGRLLADLATGTRTSALSSPVEWSRLRTFTRLSRTLAEGPPARIEDLIDAYRATGGRPRRRAHDAHPTAPSPPKASRNEAMKHPLPRRPIAAPAKAAPTIVVRPPVRAPGTPVATGRGTGDRAAHPTAPDGRGTWVVRPGDHLWHIALATLTVRSGRAPSDGELTAYARRLVATNHGRLLDPANPDLIFPGQVLELV